MEGLDGTPIMHAIEHTYVSLLADVARLSGFSEIRGSYTGLQWCLNEAPKLEKYVLSCIEEGRKLDLDAFPAQLQRIAAGSVVDPVKLRLLRQLLLFCYKAEVTHDKQTTQKALEAFKQTNRDVGSFGASLSRRSPALLDAARRHCQSVLFKFRGSEVIPFHGPGAVTTSKERWMHRYSTIEYLYPQSDWYALYWNVDACQQLADCSDEEHIVARVTAVPKDTRGPRLICVHPAEAIWIQQGLRVELERCISRHRRSVGPWPQGHVHFDDQSVNGRIALLSSASRRYATLDMKEASDRIAEPLVQALFGRNYRYFACCRAQKYVIHEGTSTFMDDLYCYAPMGNATTFPVQSLVFWAICVASLQRQGFHQPGAAFVFGDDIIVPSEAASSVIDDLESFGLIVNRTKSFWRGGFRESCGVDAFNGVNVTPIRWKATIDAEYSEGMLSLSQLAMRLRLAGYDEAAATTYAILRGRLRRLGKDMFFTNNLDHGGLAEYTTSAYLAFRDAYWHRDLQWYVSPVWRTSFIEPRLHEGDWNRVLESVCNLERTGRSSIPSRSSCRRTVLNRQWAFVQ